MLLLEVLTAPATIMTAIRRCSFARFGAARMTSCNQKGIAGYKTLLCSFYQNSLDHVFKYQVKSTIFNAAIDIDTRLLL